MLNVTFSYEGRHVAGHLIQRPSITRSSKSTAHRPRRSRHVAGSVGSPPLQRINTFSRRIFFVLNQFQLSVGYRDLRHLRTGHLPSWGMRCHRPREVHRRIGSCLRDRLPHQGQSIAEMSDTSNWASISIACRSPVQILPPPFQSSGFIRGTTCAGTRLDLTPNPPAVSTSPRPNRRV